MKRWVVSRVFLAACALLRLCDWLEPEFTVNVTNEYERQKRLEALRRRESP